MELRKEIANLRAHQDDMQVKLNLSFDDLERVKGKVRRQKQEADHSAKLRLETEKLLVELQTSQRMQELRLRTLGQASAQGSDKVKEQVSLNLTL